MPRSKNVKGAFGRQRKAILEESQWIPDDIKIDIAKVVRSVDWRSVIKDGYCFGRAATGHFLLTQLGIPAKLVFGGLVYRAGPDPSRDLLCYCDGYGYGCMIKGKIFAHQWIQSNNDLVDFSVGDWREDGARPINAVEAEVSAGLVPINWTAPELPDFFWAPIHQFAQAGHPELGEVRYTQFRGIPPDMTGMVTQGLEHARAHLIDCCKHYAFDERLSAVREGRTASLFSQPRCLGGDRYSGCQRHPVNRLETHHILPQGV
jgi:hypothetical protein